MVSILTIRSLTVYRMPSQRPSGPVQQQSGDRAGANAKELQR
jgi:hypothetical protein